MNYSVFFIKLLFFSVMNRIIPLRGCLLLEFNADGLGIGTFFSKISISVKIGWKFIKISSVIIMHLSPATVGSRTSKEAPVVGSHWWESQKPSACCHIS